jgi:hypothetical protein
MRPCLRKEKETKQGTMNRENSRCSMLSFNRYSVSTLQDTRVSMVSYERTKDPTIIESLGQGVRARY